MFVLLKNFYHKSTVEYCDKLLYTQCKLNNRLVLNKYLEQCKNKMVIPKWLVARIYNSLNSLIQRKYSRNHLANFGTFTNLFYSHSIYTNV